MRLIMAVSKDGFVARSPTDDMSWTGASDKAAFKLLTSVDGFLGCGSQTWHMMPRVLPGRRLARLSRAGAGMPLEAFAEHPDAWLIGGQRTAMSAFVHGYIRQAYICRSDRRCFPRDGEGIRYELDHWLNASLPVYRRDMDIKVGDVTVEVWNRA